MVAAVKSVRLLVNVPVDIPSVVFVALGIVGLDVVDQTNPLVVIDAPPLSVILPPLIAVVFVMDVTVAVAASVGNTANVVKLVSVP